MSGAVQAAICIVRNSVIAPTTVLRVTDANDVVAKLNRDVNTLPKICARSIAAGNRTLKCFLKAMGSPRNQLYESYDEQEDAQEENGEGELGFGDGSRSGETAARKAVTADLFPRQEAYEDVPDHKAEGGS